MCSSTIWALWRTARNSGSDRSPTLVNARGAGASRRWIAVGLHRQGSSIDDRDSACAKRETQLLDAQRYTIVDATRRALGPSRFWRTAGVQWLASSRSDGGGARSGLTRAAGV